MKNNELVLWFDEIELNDIPQVGGKNASLGEMRRALQRKKLIYLMDLL
jgi:phosphoenolpyruvate synthase (EC 2.7.9.2)